TENISLAGLAEFLLDITNTIDSVAGNPSKWHRCSDRLPDHPSCQLRLGGKDNVFWHLCRPQTRWLIGPAFRQIECPVDESVAAARHIGSEHADLAVRDLTRRTRVLPCDATRCLALLEKAGLIDHQHGIRVGEMLDDILAHNVAQRISIPPVAA